MAFSKKRSLSEMQDVDRSAAKQKDDDTYRMMVLRFEETEDEVDRQFLETAISLGINIPQDPETTLDLISNGVSGLNIDVGPPEPAEVIQPPISRTSPSIHTSSDSSIEQPRHRKTPSLAATSITSASLSSVASNKSNILKVRRGFRRISRLHKRKTEPVPDIPPRMSSMLKMPRPGLQTQRAITADQIPTISDPSPHAITTDQIHTLQVPRTRVSSLPYNSDPPPQPTLAPPPPPLEDSLQEIAGRRRSISNPVLKKLRTTQLQEQLRFISFEASQKRLLRTKHIQKKRDALSQYEQQQKDTHNQHAEALSSLETRHLDAEVDLNRTLQIERQACDTRLKHMQAYCNPRSNVEGMPSRVVTKSDYRQLEQQYHIRNGMDNLHTSRINVLREKQGKQLERIMAKQEDELELLESKFEHQNEELDTKFQTEESQLHADFAERKRRLVSRWNIQEAIERRRLELQSGEEHGPLPLITWSSSDADSKSSAPSSPVSSRGGSRLGSRGKSRDGYPPPSPVSSRGSRSNNNNHNGTRDGGGYPPESRLSYDSSNFI